MMIGCGYFKEHHQMVDSPIVNRSDIEVMSFLVSDQRSLNALVIIFSSVTCNGLK